MHSAEQQNPTFPRQPREVYRQVRSDSAALAAPLSDADATVQSMEDASPAKWHLAHTSWFFETFILVPHAKGYGLFSDVFPYLFNSYYEQVGDRFPRPTRGLLTRPSLEEVYRYRDHVDAAMDRLLDGAADTDVLTLVELGLQHEKQHQELFLTDILHLFARNPMRPAYRESQPLSVSPANDSDAGWTDYTGGTIAVGANDKAFAFDCETPRHDVLLHPYRLCNRAVTNREWVEFITDGGYSSAALWLSDGIAHAREQGWNTPLYWEQKDGVWWSVTLRGFQPVDMDAPVTHVSYYEADAFAAWAGKRLPTEAEWEQAATGIEVSGNFADSGRLRPKPQSADADKAPTGMFGDVWEWTASAFLPYPGFKAASGAVGEYNGKFMSGQMVLKGGSCASPADHLRASYRNFFQPEKRWQFSGVRLAEDI